MTHIFNFDALVNKRERYVEISTPTDGYIWDTYFNDDDEWDAFTYYIDDKQYMFDIHYDHADISIYPVYGDVADYSEDNAVVVRIIREDVCEA